MVIYGNDIPFISGISFHHSDYYISLFGAIDGKTKDYTRFSQGKNYSMDIIKMSLEPCFAKKAQLGSTVSRM